jgi:hypothetical protein
MVALGNMSWVLISAIWQEKFHIKRLQLQLKETIPLLLYFAFFNQSEATWYYKLFQKRSKKYSIKFFYIVNIQHLKIKK